MNAILKHVFQEVPYPTFPEAIIRRRFPKPKSESARFVPGSLSIKDGYQRDSGGGGKREREAERTRKERGRERGLLHGDHPERTSAKFWDICPSPSPQIHPTSLTKLWHNLPLPSVRTSFMKGPFPSMPETKYGKVEVTIFVKNELLRGMCDGPFLPLEKL